MEMKKNDLYIVSWNGVSDAGGVERVTQYMYYAWKEIFNVKIIDYECLERDGYYSLFLHKHYVIDSFLFRHYIKRLSKKNRNAKIIVQGYNCALIKSDLFFIHGTMRGVKMAVEGQNPRWHFNQLFEKIGMQKAKKVVAVGEAVKQEAIKLYGIDKNKIEVIENCVDCNLFYPIKREPSEICHILFCGRLEYRKGVDVLLKLANLVEREQEYRLLIATNSRDNTDLFMNMKNTEVYIGLKRDEMNAYYNKGDIMFFPSRYEGYEMVTTECLAAGIPVMGNMVGAVRDLYQKGIKGVEIIPSNDEAILPMIRELKEAYKSIDDRYVLHNEMKCNRNLEQYILVLRDLIEREWRIAE